MEAQSPLRALVEQHIVGAGWTPVLLDAVPDLGLTPTQATRRSATLDSGSVKTQEAMALALLEGQYPGATMLYIGMSRVIGMGNVQMSGRDLTVKVTELRDEEGQSTCSASISLTESPPVTLPQIATGGVTLEFTDGHLSHAEIAGTPYAPAEEEELIARCISALGMESRDDELDHMETVRELRRRLNAGGAELSTDPVGALRWRRAGALPPDTSQKSTT